MRFNSNSVVLNRGVECRVPIETPPAFKHYKFKLKVLHQAIDEFNKKLDERKSVTTEFDGLTVDVLRLELTGADRGMALWVSVKEEDFDSIRKIPFTIKGEVYFVGDSDVEVDDIVINDLMYSDTAGIFTS